MKFRRRTLLHWLAATSAASLASRIALAQSFPTRPITIVVPFPAGGPTDTLGRVLADRMKNALGQSVIIENLTGAAGTIGSTHVARSPPDGYTLILGHWQTHVVNGATFTLPFDVVDDFAPISLIADCPMWLVGRSGLAAQSLPELIAWMKESPAKATVGIGGVGGGADVVGTYFQKNTGTQFQFVPYRGAAPMMQDLLAGHIDLTFTQVASALASTWHWIATAAPVTVKLIAGVALLVGDATGVTTTTGATAAPTTPSAPVRFVAVRNILKAWLLLFGVCGVLAVGTSENSWPMFVGLNTLARPQSMTWTSPKAPTMMLAGFRSR